jgi:hypothetical protein
MIFAIVCGKEIGKLAYLELAAEMARYRPGRART